MINDRGGATLLLEAAGWQDPPCVLPDSVELRRDLVFARPAGVALGLDLFRPRWPGPRRPGLVFLYGGGWRQGSRQQFWRQAIHLATQGVVGVCASYRHVPAFTFPAQLEDAQAAVRWLRGQAEGLGVDPERIGAIGGSAGGHLAALLGTTEAVVDSLSARVQAVVAFNPPLDLTTLDTEGARDTVAAFLRDNRELAKAASPFWQADTTAAPTLLLHGTADAGIPFSQAQSYQERLRDLGVRAELFAAEGAGHGFFNRPPFYQPALERMTEFVLDTLHA